MRSTNWRLGSASSSRACAFSRLEARRGVADSCAADAVSNSRSGADSSDTSTSESLLFLLRVRLLGVFDFVCFLLSLFFAVRRDFFAPGLVFASSRAIASTMSSSYTARAQVDLLFFVFVVAGAGNDTRSGSGRSEEEPEEAEDTNEEADKADDCSEDENEVPDVLATTASEEEGGKEDDVEGNTEDEEAVAEVGKEEAEDCTGDALDEEEAEGAEELADDDGDDEEAEEPSTDCIWAVNQLGRGFLPGPACLPLACLAIGLMGGRIDLRSTDERQKRQHERISATKHIRMKVADAATGRQRHKSRPYLSRYPVG